MKVKFKTIQDVKAWRQLKKEELDLERLLLKSEKAEFKTGMIKKVGEVVFMEMALLMSKFTIGKIFRKMFEGFFTTEKSGKTENTQKGNS